MITTRSNRPKRPRYGSVKGENPFLGPYYPALDGLQFPLTAFYMIVGTMSLLTDIERSSGGRRSGSYLKKNMLDAGYSIDQYNRIPRWAEQQGFVKSTQNKKNGHRTYKMTKKGRMLNNAYVIPLDSSAGFDSHKWRIIANLSMHYYGTPPSKRQLSALLGWHRNSFDYSKELCAVKITSLAPDLEP